MLNQATLIYVSLVQAILYLVAQISFALCNVATENLQVAVKRLRIFKKSVKPNQTKPAIFL
jgi:hypothetical protein